MNRSRDLLHVLLMAASVAGGLWLGKAGPMLLDPRVARSSSQVVDNSRYFAGETVDVVLFGTATCRWCVQARTFLDSLGVDYRDHRIDESASAEALYQTLGAQAVPVVLVGNRRIEGYDEPAIRDALATLTPRPGSPPPRR